MRPKFDRCGGWLACVRGQTHQVQFRRAGGLREEDVDLCRWEGGVKNAQRTTGPTCAATAHAARREGRELFSGGVPGGLEGDARFRQGAGKQAVRVALNSPRTTGSSSVAPLESSMEKITHRAFDESTSEPSTTGFCCQTARFLPPKPDLKIAPRSPGRAKRTLALGHPAPKACHLPRLLRRKPRKKGQPIPGGIFPNTETET